jgi:hypothetical protein
MSAPAPRRADLRLIGPLPFAGGQAGLLAGRDPGDLQLVVYDDAWPDGAAGSLARPSLTRFVTAATLAELDAIRAALADVLGARR